MVGKTYSRKVKTRKVSKLCQRQKEKNGSPYYAYGISFLGTRKLEISKGREITYQVISLNECIPDVLKELHDGHSRGYFSVNRKLARIKERYY